MYKSPLHALTAWFSKSESGLSPDYLKTLKTQLVMQFDQDKLPTISRDGTVYNKEEILKSIDQLINDPDFSLHVFIYAHKSLLNFLEDENFDLKELTLETPAIPSELTLSLSILLYERVLWRIKRSSADYNFDDLVILYTTNFTFSEAQKESLFGEAQKTLQTLTDQLKEVSSGTGVNMPENFYFLERASFPLFLNAFYKHLENEINELVQATLDALTHYQNSISTHDKKYLYEVSLLLSQVDCKSSLRQTVKKYAQIFSANYKGYDEENMAPKKLSKAYWLFVIPLFFIVRPALNFLSNQNSQAKKESDSHNALHKWPIKPVKNEAQTFAGYRAFMATEDSDTGADYSRDCNVLTDRKLSGQSPFLFVVQPNSLAEDTAFRKIVISNKTNLHLILISLYPGSADAFLFFPQHPDTLYLKPEAKLCFYFGDSILKLKEDLNMDVDNEFWTNSLREVRFANRDPLAKALFQENFILDFKNKNMSKKEKLLPELELTDDFFITKLIETKKIKLHPDVSTTASR